MKWLPAQCSPGDIVRVRVGPIWHYGIFVSDDEVIQFGEPPVNGPLAGNNQKVIATDIDFFASGGIVERSELDRAEEKKRFSREKTIELARSRLGEGGYDILHNNCEHFVNECVFGVSRSLQEEEMRKKWLSRPFLDVYITLIPDELQIESVYPPERAAEIERVKNERARREKYAVWKLLEKAVSRSFGLTLEELSFKKRRDGKWVSDRVEFSLSHSKGAAAVAVSNCPVGIDIENAEDFISRHSGKAELTRLAKRVCTAAELSEADTAEGFLRLWTKKEAIFKCYGSGGFFPHKIDASSKPTETREISLPARCSLSVCGEKLQKARYYFVSEKGALPMEGAKEMK